MTRTLLLAATLTPLPCMAATLHVGDGQTYSAIQDAIDAAATGDTIVVHEGTYTEQLIVDDAGIASLTIRAASGDTVSVEAPSDKVVAIIVKNADLRLKGFAILAADHEYIPPMGIRAVSATPPGADDFTLTLCNMTIEDHSITDSKAISCGPWTGDSITVQGYDVTISAFDLEGESSCLGYTGGWDWDLDYVCTGW